jgi:hypothetical protein
MPDRMGVYSGFSSLSQLNAPPNNTYQFNSVEAGEGRIVHNYGWN